MFSLRNENGKTKKIILIGITVFFILGIYSVIAHGNEHFLGSFEKWDNDDVKYVRSAWTLMDTGKLTYHDVNEETVFIMPGISYTLAGIMTIFGKTTGLVAFRVFQVILEVLSLMLVFFIARKLFNSKVGIIAFILEAIYIPNLWVTHVILTECIFKFLVLALVYFTIYAIEEKKIIYYVIGGMLLGITCLFRPTIGAYPIVVLVLWLYKKYEFKDIIKWTIVVTSVFALVMSPWWIRNYNTFNRFIPCTLSSGNPMIQGSYINYDANIDFYPTEGSDDRIEQEKLYMDNVKYRFKNYMLRSPVKYGLWYFVEKPVILWGGPFYWRKVYSIHYLIAFIQHLAYLILGLYGMYFIFKRRKMEKGNPIVYLLFSLCLYYTIIHIPYVTFDRYGYPMIWIFTISASVVLEKYFENRKIQ
ncbi:ArnT family glycosyltransferase [Clostridium frigidicarnis]|uniref:Dolichyl-phosphate-mannose-protein mannosyltransferase n=1 Tax=Clostridium frigidicarnis TaxID=84698 RepID=A0A1I1AF35_9CLOT|nr:glycosyltransferase family 39 protein [Clostridium frigidicarnis]SFB35986.1 Dolichyl-phosphate-mannose-protein mannosyltransferase [Clostridium frigidicarnis]